MFGRVGVGGENEGVGFHPFSVYGARACQSGLGVILQQCSCIEH